MTSGTKKCRLDGLLWSTKPEHPAKGTGVADYGRKLTVINGSRHYMCGDMASVPLRRRPDLGTHRIYKYTAGRAAMQTTNKEMFSHGSDAGQPKSHYQ